MRKTYDSISTNDLAVLAKEDSFALSCLLLRLENAARSAVSHYQPSVALSREDLMQDAYIGVCSKVSDYQKEKGAAVSYFSQAMKYEIWNDIRKHSRLVSLPFQKQTLLRSYEKLEGDKLSDEELIAALRLSDRESLVDLRSAASASSILSLDVPYGDEEDSSMASFVSDSFSTEDTVLESLEVARVLETAKRILSGLERKVFLSYCGFGKEPYSVSSLSAACGVTPVTVRNTLNRAVAKLRAALVS